MKKLTKKEALEFLGLDKKVFDNYVKNAGEIRFLSRKKRGRYYFDKGELKKWLNDCQSRTIELSVSDYFKCLDFALAIHFRGYVLADWGKARQREFGQKIANWVRGQLGELAVRKFLKNEFNVDVKLDFEIHDHIISQDIIGIEEKGKTRNPKTKVGIKSSKPKSAFLVLGKNEVELPDRRSDIYIFCRPDLPDDHLLSIAKDQIAKAVKSMPHYNRYKDKMTSLSSMPCEIVGWCKIDELKKATSIPGQSFEGGARYIKKSGLLHRSRKDWERLMSWL